jgi:hypothetical protein
MSALGKMPIERNLLGQILLIGNMPVKYRGWLGSVNEIGDVRIGFRNFGQMTDISTVSGRDLDRRQKLALVVILIEKLASDRNSP